MAKPVRVHASAVAFGSKAILIIGASGSGKSTLALQLMALGAVLVGDDRLVLRRTETGLTVAPVPALENLIEARGIGILRSAAKHPAHLHLCIDLDLLERERVPPRRVRTFLNTEILCLHKVESPAFPAMILQYVKGGRAEV